MEVWLEGERGVAHQLLVIDSTLKENLNNRTVTEFPVLHVVTRGMGAPHCGALREPQASQVSTPASRTTEGCASGRDTEQETVDLREWSDTKQAEECREKVPAPSASLKLIASMYDDDGDSASDVPED